MVVVVLGMGLEQVEVVASHSATGAEKSTPRTTKTTTRTTTAMTRKVRNKIYEKTGLELEVPFVEELIEYVAMAAIEGLKMQNQIFTIHVDKGAINEPEEPGENDDDETQH